MNQGKEDPRIQNAVIEDDGKEDPEDAADMLLRLLYGNNWAEDGETLRARIAGKRRSA